MTWPRRIVPGTTYLLTRRCTQRRFMLVPRGIVPKLFGYCVACTRPRVTQGPEIIGPDFGS